MDRKEIKASAREKIKGNIWNILWPLLVIGLASGLIDRILQRIFGLNSIDVYNYESLSNVHVPPTYYLLSIIITIILGFLSAGYIKYIINFVRTGKFDTKEIIETFKTKWQQLLIADILVFVIVYLCTLLLIVPGIIMGLAYSFVTYLIVDSNISGKDALTKSREMMKGYKWNYFVFSLSFLGWIILGIFTLGILYIWLVPYITIANTIYYEKLKEQTK